MKIMLIFGLIKDSSFAFSLGLLCGFCVTPKQNKMVCSTLKNFKIILVPNITNICYGRGVGYKIEEIVMPEEIQKISATKIRAKMREDGELK